MWPNHMIGTNNKEKIVAIAKLPRNRNVPPNARRSLGRVSTSIAVAMFGANHVTSTIVSRAMPASARMKAAPDPVQAMAAVPMTRSPIQAGEAMNIRIASPSW